MIGLMKRGLLLVLLAAGAEASHAQDWAVERLEASPRHHEWVEIPSGERVVRAFVAYPERSEPTPAVIVIHENRGLTDWVRSFADQIAAAGHLAVAPDLLSDFDSEHARTSDFQSSDAARDAIYQLDPDQVVDDLGVVQRFVAELPAASGKVAVAGFCWGGAQSFRYATHAPDLAAAFVFYGSAPEDVERIRAISAPIYGFYGGEDARINAGIPATEERMNQLGKTYEAVIYPGAGHGFMRSGEEPDASDANRRGREQAWDRLTELLEELKGGGQ